MVSVVPLKKLIHIHIGSVFMLFFFCIFSYYVYNLIEKFKQVKEEKIVEEARTRMRTRSENLYSKKMVKVYIMYIYIYI